MRFFSLLFSIICFYVFTSCSSQFLGPIDSEIVDFEIHFQNDFNNDDVLLKFDNNNIYAGKLTTNYTISLAKAFQLQAYSGEHVLFINLNNTHSMQTQFTLTDSLYILIRFHDERNSEAGFESGFDIEMTHDRPYYD